MAIALRRTARTLSVSPARDDYPKIITGHKREFRSIATMTHQAQEGPRPILVYRTKPYAVDEFEVKLMMLERLYREPLGAISQTSLQLEGFSSVREFRDYWRDLHPKVGYEPLREVAVVRLRPWELGDDLLAAEALLRKLYGEWMP